MKPFDTDDFIFHAFEFPRLKRRGCVFHPNVTDSRVFLGIGGHDDGNRGHVGVEYAAAIVEHDNGALPVELQEVAGI